MDWHAIAIPYAIADNIGHTHSVSYENRNFYPFSDAVLHVIARFDAVPVIEPGDHAYAECHGWYNADGIGEHNVIAVDFAGLYGFTDWVGWGDTLTHSDFFGEPKPDHSSFAHFFSHIITDSQRVGIPTSGA